MREVHPTKLESVLTYEVHISCTTLFKVYCNLSDGLVLIKYLDYLAKPLIQTYLTVTISTIYCLIVHGVKHSHVLVYQFQLL